MTILYCAAKLKSVNISESYVWDQTAKFYCYTVLFNSPSDLDLPLVDVVVETAAAASPGLVEWAFADDEEGIDFELTDTFPTRSFLLAS